VRNALTGRAEPRPRSDSGWPPRPGAARG
jgi:hypothetical protein